MKEKNALVLIPARFGSTRYPGKPLEKLCGKMIIEHVYTNIASSGFESYVVTDDDRIEKAVHSFGGKVCRIDDDVPSGTERIYLAYERYFSKSNYEYVINVQGDEPLLKGEKVKELLHFHRENDPHVATMVREIKGLDEDYKDPSKVKVAYSKKNGKCFYFSRASIPFVRDLKSEKDKNLSWFLHIGVYSYKVKALEEFAMAPMSYYERLEKLEQLRGLDLGFSYGAILNNDFLSGVDTPEDLKKLEGVLCAKNS